MFTLKSTHTIYEITYDKKKGPVQADTDKYEI